MTQLNEDHINRIMTLLENLSANNGANSPQIDVSALASLKNHAAIYENGTLRPIRLHSIPYELIEGADYQKQQIYDNMLRYFNGLPANHALLWGARGTGKSSVVKGSFQKLLQQETALSPFLLEIHAQDIAVMPAIIRQISQFNRPLLIFCDDLSFELNDSAYKALKSLLDGSIENLESQILFYATSNRRHLLAYEHDSTQSNVVQAQDSREEKISLSDRFGLWIGFHPLSQDTYLQIIENYFAHFNIKEKRLSWQASAIEWSRTRGSLSGRTAWQFFKDYAAKANHVIAWDNINK